LIHLIQHSQNPSHFPVCEYNFTLLRAKLTNEKKAIEDKIKSITNMNVAELTKHMKAPLQDDEAAVILTSGFRASQPNVAAAAAPAAQPNVAAAPKKKRTTSKLKKKHHQQPPPLADPNIDDSNMERRDTKVTFAASSGTKLGASSSRVQNLEPATQKIVHAEDRNEARSRRNLWKEMSKCCVLNATLNATGSNKSNATLNATGSNKSNKSKKKKSSTVHHLAIMLSTDISGFEIEEHGLHQGSPFPVYPFKTLVASSTNHKLALGINELVGERMKTYTITNRMGMREKI
jgi:hypothetical protein